MTNVFVHYWRPGAREITNAEMLFSRIPTQGESIYFNDLRYEVVRVDHHPGRNAKSKNARDLDGIGIPEDAEIWLKRVTTDPNPIWFEDPTRKPDDTRAGSKVSNWQGIFNKAIERLEGEERRVAEEARDDLLRWVAAMGKVMDLTADSPDFNKTLASVRADMTAIRNKYQLPAL